MSRSGNLFSSRSSKGSDASRSGDSSSSESKKGSGGSRSKSSRSSDTRKRRIETQRGQQRKRRKQKQRKRQQGQGQRQQGQQHCATATAIPRDKLRPGQPPGKARVGTPKFDMLITDHPPSSSRYPFLSTTERRLSRPNDPRTYGVSQCWHGGPLDLLVTRRLLGRRRIGGSWGGCVGNWSL